MTSTNWVAGHVVAGLLWFAAVVLCVMDLFLGNDDVGHLGIVAAAAAGTLNIRCWVDGARARDREWYELGREVASRRPKVVQ